MEYKALRMLRHPVRTRKIRDYLEDYNNLKSTFDSEIQYDRAKSPSDIVDGIRVEAYRPKSEIRENGDSKNEDRKSLNSEKIFESAEDEISALLSELEQLDEMLIQASSEIKKEMDKKQEIKVCVNKAKSMEKKIQGFKR